jgi:hypothetical protein
MPARFSKIGRLFPRIARSTPSRAAQPNLRQRHFEALEDRRLLALTVIAHGAADSFPAWVYDMGGAVAARGGTYDTRDQNADGIADVIQNSRIGWNGNPPLVGSQQRRDDLILFDWAAQSEIPGTADSDEVVGSLVTEIHNRLAAVGAGVLDLHFIGFDRGAFVNAELIERLTVDSLAARIGFVQMTTLDWRTNGSEGIVHVDPVGIVDFADNYYQVMGDENPFAGPLVSGALNIRLDAQILAWEGREEGDDPAEAHHQEVHDWYHWTIASSVVATDSVSLVDDALVVPTSSDRELLYDSYEADLNNDEVFDDFGGGANFGYYFSIGGGGIGNVVRSGLSAYTIDVRTGAIPLYLGDIASFQHGVPTGLAYAPNGDLNYLTEIAPGLKRFRMRFNAFNEPVVVRQGVGLDGFMLFGEEAGLRYRPDGTLYVSALNKISQITGTPLALQTKYSAPGLGMLEVLQAMAFDHRGTAYAVTFDLQSGKSGKLLTIAADFSSASTPVNLPYTDVISLSVIGGLLYAFRENGAYFTYNLVTQQIVNHDEIAHPALATIDNVASLVTLAKPNWHNRDLRADVTGDGRVTTNDVIALVNTILSKGTRTIDSADLLSFYYDANNDGRVTTADLIIVINHILQAQLEAAPLASEPLAAPAVEPNPSVQPNSADLSTVAADHAAAAEFNALAFALALQGIEDDEAAF